MAEKNPVENLDLANAPLIKISCLHVKKHQQTIDRSKFFGYKQTEKQSDQRFVAEIRRLYDQINIHEMSGKEILAYQVCPILKPNKNVHYGVEKNLSNQN